MPARPAAVRLPPPLLSYDTLQRRPAAVWACWPARTSPSRHWVSTGFGRGANRRAQDRNHGIRIIVPHSGTRITPSHLLLPSTIARTEYRPDPRDSGTGFPTANARVVEIPPEVSSRMISHIRSLACPYIRLVSTVTAKAFSHLNGGRSVPFRAHTTWYSHTAPAALLERLRRHAFRILAAPTRF